MIDRLGQLRVRMLTSVILGMRQLRNTWRLFLVAGAGILVAIVLTLFAPAYTFQSLQTGLNQTLARYANPKNNTDANLALSFTATENFRQVLLRSYPTQDMELRALLQQQVGSYLLPQSEHSLQLSDLDLHTRTQLDGEQFIRIIGGDISQVASDLTLVQGRLPTNQSGVLEAALPVEVAQELQLSVGSTYTIPLGLDVQNQPVVLPLQIVGTFQSPATSSLPFLQQENLHIERTFGLTGPVAAFFPFLVAQQPLLTAMSELQVSQTLLKDGATMTVWWEFHPNLQRIDIEHLNDVVSRFSTLANIINQQVTDSSIGSIVIGGVLVQSDNPLQTFAAQVQVVAIPIVILLFDILSLLLFFIILIADLFIGGQATTIAQLRNRGISRVQLFGAYLLQSLGLGIGALLLGMALTVPLENFLLPRLLPSGVPTLSLSQGLSYGATYALLVSGFAVLALWLAIITALQGNVVGLRREASRAQGQPLWQRLHLDLMLGFVLLIAFGISTYVAQVPSDPQSAALLTPLSLIAPTFLVIAGILFLLRALPWFFQLGARLTTRRRDAVPFLAFLQLSRAPQTTLRLLLVFALTVAFTVYVFIFSASQSARIFDLSAQQVGADFVGNITPLSTSSGTLSMVTASFRAIPGVISATAGYEDYGSPTAQNGVSLVNAVVLDTDTYANTAIWPGQLGNQSIRNLLRQLSAGRQSARTSDTVPALVDSATWDAFHLTTGAIFHLSFGGYDSGNSMRLVAMAEVPTIPSTAATDPGILVDYATFSNVRLQDTAQAAISPNRVWLRTQGDAASLDTIIKAFNAPATKLQQYQSRRSIVTTLLADPLASLIAHLLTLGLVVPLVLAFIGNLLALWTQMRQQIVLFALVRALGMVPAQIGSLLTWELGIMQLLALLLGGLFGWLLAVTLTPALVFTTTTADQLDTANAFYSLQTVLPVRIVVPPLAFGISGLIIAFILGMIAIVVLALRRLTISQTLRLNED